MADPRNKYAGLPGIASPDEKDVYETDDLPEADQGDLLEEAESENIERFNINVKNSHDRFKGKALVPSKGMDFSDAARRKRNIGYLAVSGEWELAADGEPETLLQRRNRLQAEFRALIDDINECSGKESATEGERVGSLVPELETSLKELSSLKIPETSTTPAQHIENIQKLIKELNDAEKKKAGVTKKSGANEQKTGDGVVLYQLNAFPAHSNFEKSARVADLDLRLKKLEHILGASPDNLSRLELTDVKSVVEGIDELTTRTNLLNLNTIDTIDTKLANLISKMDALTEKRGGPLQVELEAKINEIYESYKKVDTLSRSLLPVGERLAALSSLHKDAGEFKKIVSQLKGEVNEMSKQLTNEEATAQAVREDMRALLAAVTTNMDNFNKRLTAVKK